MRTQIKRRVTAIIVLLQIYTYSLINGTTQLSIALEKLKSAYPEHIIAVTPSYITWADNSLMLLDHHAVNDPSTEHDTLNNPSLKDQLEQPSYIKGESSQAPSNDPGRIRYEPFFRKLYGNSPEEVHNNLTPIVWMPRIFGQNAQTLYVTRVNNVHEKIQAISQELEQLVLSHPKYKALLDNPGGTFNWRFIANTTRLSNHSFGMTIDINAALTHYWQWDLARNNLPVHENTSLTYCTNTVPWEIISIFEKYGFIWGGKWYHYDTMHFEYRPELTMDAP